MNNSKWTWKYKDSNRVEWEIKVSRGDKLMTIDENNYYETEWNYSIFNVDHQIDIYCGHVNTQYDQIVLLDEILCDYHRSVGNWIIGFARFAKIGD